MTRNLIKDDICVVIFISPGSNDHGEQTAILLLIPDGHLYSFNKEEVVV
jgi:hypothetical protein